MSLVLYALTVITCTVNEKRTTLQPGDLIPEGIAPSDLKYLQDNNKVSKENPAVQAGTAKAANTAGTTDEQLKAAFASAAQAHKEADEANQKLLDAQAAEQTAKDDAAAARKDADNANQKLLDAQAAEQTAKDDAAAARRETNEVKQKLLDAQASARQEVEALKAELAAAKAAKSTAKTANK